MKTGIPQAVLDAGGWTHPPIQLTPALVETLRGDAVQIPYTQLPPGARDGYQVEEDTPDAETIYGYFYLTDEGQHEELTRGQAANVFIELGGRSYFYPLGGHGEGGCPLRDLTAGGRLFLISYEDFLSFAAGVPDQYRLERLTVDRSREDPYLRLCERLSVRSADQDQAGALLRAARAGR